MYEEGLHIRHFVRVHARCMWPLQTDCHVYCGPTQPIRNTCQPPTGRPRTLKISLSKRRRKRATALILHIALVYYRFSHSTPHRNCTQRGSVPSQFLSEVSPPLQTKPAWLSLSLSLFSFSLSLSISQFSLFRFDSQICRSVHCSASMTMMTPPPVDVSTNSSLTFFLLRFSLKFCLVVYFWSHRVAVSHSRSNWLENCKFAHLERRFARVMIQ